MFAKRRSALSYHKLPCLNIVFLTCCLLAVAHVSSMSLDRQRRQYQQQTNDKQLEFSEFLLPEAESEILQNDMELVPAIDGDSDMYLLVPASAVSQEQNLQTLTETNESQNSGNVESNSDMLMQESEDTPSTQFLELPQDDLNTNIHEELVSNNDIDQEYHSADENNQHDSNMDEQISESMLNTIAEAAQEIQAELVGNDDNIKIEDAIQEEYAKQKENTTPIMELSVQHKENEPENIDFSAQEQESIGVVMEQSSEAAADDLEAFDLRENEENNEGLQINNVEMQPSKASLSQESQENNEEEKSSEIETNDAYDSPPAIELAQSVEEKNDGDKTNGVNADSQIMQGNELLKNEESETRIETENQKVEANINEMQPKDEIGEDQVAEKEQYRDQNLNESQIDEEIQTKAEQGSIADGETGMKTDTEEIKADVERADVSQSAEEIPAEYNKSEDESAEESNEIHTFPTETQSVMLERITESSIESQAFVDTLNSEKLQATEENANTQENQPTESDDEIENLQLAPVSIMTLSSDVSGKYDQAHPVSGTQIIEEYNKEDHEENLTEDEFHLSKPNQNIELFTNIKQTTEEDQKKEVEPVEESQGVVNGQDSAEVQYSEINDKNSEQNETGEKDQLQESIANPEDVQSNEDTKPVDEIQLSEEFQNFEKINENQTAEKVQNADDAKLEEELLEIAEHDEETEAADDAQPTENPQSVETVQAIEDIKPFAEAPYEETIASVANVQTIEHKTESSEDSQSTENTQAAEEDQTVGNIQSAYEDEKEVEPSEENQTEVEIFDIAGTTETYVDPIASNIEMTSLLLENEDADAQILTSFSEMQEPESNEYTAAQKESETHEVKPLVGILPNEVTTQEFNQQKQEENASQPIVLANENNQNAEPDEDNQNEKVQDATAVIQEPFVDKNSDNILNNDTNESAPIKETTSVLTTIVQVPTNEELAQQQQQQQQYEQQEQEPTVGETVNSATSKPFNVLDSVLNYVNASLMNQMSNDNPKQEVKEEEEAEQVFSSKLRRYDGAQVWRIVVQNDRERKLADELQAKYDGQLWKEVKQEVDYLLKPQVLADAEKYIKAANLTRIVLIENLQEVIEVENPPAEEIEQLQNRKGYRLTWQAYHRLEDIHGFFDYLAKTYSDICSVEIIGYSIEKRPLKILKISNGNVNNSGIWLDGGMHAREWISPSVITYIAHQIVEGWEDLPAYMRNINWYLHAVANPDGYEYSHTTDRLWRKNMRSHGRACPGVDLNRNFGYKWGGKGTSANPCSQTYRGSKAFSEPETFYISKFISNFPRDTFKAYLSFHSYGQYILYPWGYDYHITNDMADLDLVARQAGTIITKSTGAKFTVGSSATTLYPAAGGSDDWAKGIAGIKYAYTIEMGDTGRYGFVLPANYIEPNGKNGLTVVETVAKAITVGKNARRRKLKAYKFH